MTDKQKAILPPPLVLSAGTAALSHSIDDYPGGIIIPIDKPYRWTSADVIRKVKFAACRHFGKKNLKVGHAGTLDPLATGVLLVCIGNATKLAETLQAHDKEYIAGISFGATTPSYDLEKEIDRHFPYGHIDENAVRAALPAFLGEHEQIAPLFSAKSVDGVRAYELARKLYKEKQLTPHNEDIPGTSGTASTDDDSNTASVTSAFDAAAEAVIRTSIINISEIELLSFTPGKSTVGYTTDNQSNETSDGIYRASDGVSAETQGDVKADETKGSRASLRINVTDNSALGLPEAKIRIACSKGTYIRAFARDLGEALNTGAHLSSLQRSRSGRFRIETAMSVSSAIALLG